MWVWQVVECYIVVVYHGKLCETKFWLPVTGQVRQLHLSTVSFSYKSKCYTLMSQKAMITTENKDLHSIHTCTNRY